MKKDDKRMNKHYKEMLDHYESIIDSIQLDEKTTQMFASLFAIASKVNDKTINKVVREIDNFRKKECIDNAEWLKENGCTYDESEITYEGLFNFDEEMIYDDYKVLRKDAYNDDDDEEISDYDDYKVLRKDDYNDYEV